MPYRIVLSKLICNLIYLELVTNNSQHISYCGVICYKHLAATTWREADVQPTRRLRYWAHGCSKYIWGWRSISSRDLSSEVWESYHDLDDLLWIKIERNEKEIWVINTNLKLFQVGNSISNLFITMQTSNSYMLSIIISRYSFNKWLLKLCHDFIN